MTHSSPPAKKTTGPDIALSASVAAASASPVEMSGSVSSPEILASSLPSSAAFIMPATVASTSTTYPAFAFRT
jgi:hypothetical protein